MQRYTGQVKVRMGGGMGRFSACPTIKYLRALLALILACCACAVPTFAESTPTPVSEVMGPEEATVAPGGGGNAAFTATPAPIGKGGEVIYYIRPDGGSATQCNGQKDAPYPGQGSNQPCAWDHPFRALPPGGTPRLRGGETLVIAVGSYRMGIGAPETNGICDPTVAWDCHMPPIPSGPDPTHPTRILGQGWDTGCKVPPELWGTERANYILNLEGSSNVQLACLEVTDHSSCAEGHPSSDLACQRDQAPFGDWAAVGLWAVDAHNVLISNLNIHGLANAGVHAGRLKDWTVEDVRLAANGLAGWDGDVGDSANFDTLTFRRWLVEWNGCPESYPDRKPVGCWGQQEGGYGDGVGTAETGGHWIIEDSAFLYNTQDGLDLLYVRLPESQIDIRTTIAEGNAGNQIKTNGPTTIENSIVVGNCAFFKGQPFMQEGDLCRAMGNALSLALQPGDQVSVTHSTLASQGDCLVVANCEGVCTGKEVVRMRNNIFVGAAEYLQPDEATCLAWPEGFSQNPFDMDYSLVFAAKDTPPCPGKHDLCGADPGLANASLEAFDAHLRPGSLAINAGIPEGAPAMDFDGNQRDSKPDIGAYEWR